MVTEPTVAAIADADNEYGRCKVLRENCFRGSSQDQCQVCLRCNVDYQYQTRTFSKQEINQETACDGAQEHTPEHTDVQQHTKDLPGMLGWLAKRTPSACTKTLQMLGSLAVGARSSAVADFYATKYLAKPQQWLTSALGRLTAGFREIEEEHRRAKDQPSLKTAALRKVRTAIFAASRTIRTKHVCS